jgi:imidazole glycerol-phosphate synthase subunit HisH
MIGILNYRIGNLASVYNAISFLKTDCIFIEDSKDFNKVDKIILPGVGHFKKGMDNLLKYNLLEGLVEHVIGNKKPCLGICLGMQLMFSYSEEAKCDGLGWLKGDVRIINSNNLRVPNIGWWQVEKNNTSKILEGINLPTFYFVHSYYVDGDQENVTSYINADIKVCATAEKDNISAVQFHPEKSQQDGLTILSNFIKGI